MPQPIHHQAVVDLIGEHHKPVLPGDIGDRLQGLVGIYGACRVVGIDDEYRLGLIGDFFADVLYIRVPVVRRIAAVEDGLSAGKIRVVAPQAVAGGGKENFFARADQRFHDHGGGFRYTIADKDVIGQYSLQASADMVSADDVPGILHAAYIAVRHRFVDMERQRLPDGIRQTETKPAGVPRIELQHVRTFGFHSQRFLVKRTADIGMHVLQPVRRMDHKADLSLVF